MKTLIAVGLSCWAVACGAGAPFQPTRVLYVPPAVESEYPGVTVSARLAADGWCRAEGLCSLIVHDDSTTEPVVSADLERWVMAVADTSAVIPPQGAFIPSNKSYLAFTDFDRQVVWLFRAAEENPRIRYNMREWSSEDECRAASRHHNIAVNLDLVINHELGHVLGLGHANASRLVMTPPSGCEFVGESKFYN